MKYAIFCYHSEDFVCSWSKEEDDAVMVRLDQVHGKVAAAGRLGPVARLMPTTAATTVRKGLDGKQDQALVIDGPFAETKEQLLGFYLVDCETLEEAVAIARDLAHANPGGAYEIRPVGIYLPGVQSR
ncbi:MAG TPA: YciI family protein [Xanthobacteraceae bacterium]|nr:YciI family protein [Xanthobacteraceae bacterium]